jgi:DNA-binding NarL/FixJ family response regulator
MRVLIADDSEVFVRHLLQALGEIKGVEIVGHARTGAEALQAVCNLRPEVVILDIRMPEGSGIDVLESMKREKVTPITIVLTNFNYSQYRKKCLQLGARFFFDKSAEFAKVGEVLRLLAHRASASTEDGFDVTEHGAP